MQSISLWCPSMTPNCPKMAGSAKDIPSSYLTLLHEGCRGRMDQILDSCQNIEEDYDQMINCLKILQKQVRQLKAPKCYYYRRSLTPYLGKAQWPVRDQLTLSTLQPTDTYSSVVHLSDVDDEDVVKVFPSDGGTEGLDIHDSSLDPANASELLNSFTANRQIVLDYNPSQLAGSKER